jgi:hypothetical protein
MKTINQLAKSAVAGGLATVGFLLGAFAVFFLKLALWVYK